MNSRDSPVHKPRDFQPVGTVTQAHMRLTDPGFIRPRRYKGRRAQGVRYERKAQQYLQERYREQHFRGPWLEFRDDGKQRWCQPDALVVDVAAGRITVVEVKYQHTVQAWWQLYHLYLPVLRVMFPPAMWQLMTCEVVRWYDPQVEFPCRVTLTPEPTALKVNEFGVHIWRAA